MFAAQTWLDDSRFPPNRWAAPQFVTTAMMVPPKNMAGATAATPRICAPYRSLHALVESSAKCLTGGDKWYNKMDVTWCNIYFLEIFFWRSKRFKWQPKQREPLELPALSISFCWVFCRCSSNFDCKGASLANISWPRTCLKTSLGFKLVLGWWDNHLEAKTCETYWNLMFPQSLVFPLKFIFRSIPDPESNFAGASGAGYQSEMSGAQEGRKSAQRMNWTWPIWINLIHREWPLNIRNENVAKIMAWNSFKTSDVSVVTLQNGRLDTKQWNKQKTEVATPSALAFWSLGEEEKFLFFSIPRSQKIRDQLCFWITN